MRDVRNIALGFFIIYLFISLVDYPCLSYM
eukprot:COSAG01_NODE_1721_length_9391_cov_5.427249_2_plen_30_part_00